MLGMNRQKPNTAIMKKLELTPEDDVVYLKRLRHVNDKPVMIEHEACPAASLNSFWMWIWKTSPFMR